MISGYKLCMAKAEIRQQKTGEWAVRDSRTGRFIEVRGANSMKKSKLPLQEGLDLTKPIAEQALKVNTSKTSASSKKD